MDFPKNLFLTGSPGVGKTTLLKECTYPFIEYVGGYITEEMRQGPIRKGFLLKTFQGGSAVLASKDLESETKVNKYGVDLHVLEDLGVGSIQWALDKNKVIVVDEIGTMEMLSKKFCDSIAKAMISGNALLATIRLNAQPFTSQIKKMSNTELLHLEKKKQFAIKKKIQAWLEAKCSK